MTPTKRSALSSKNGKWLRHPVSRRRKLASCGGPSEHEHEIDSQIAAVLLRMMRNEDSIRIFDRSRVSCMTWFF
jgi:hypothetical protein